MNCIASLQTGEMHAMRRTPVHKPVDFRLMIPQEVGVLYVDSHGAGSPQGNCLDLRFFQ
jgi:hypothetical protein